MKYSGATSAWRAWLFAPTTKALLVPALSEKSPVTARGPARGCYSCVCVFVCWCVGVLVCFCVHFVCVSVCVRARARMCVCMCARARVDICA